MWLSIGVSIFLLGCGSSASSSQKNTTHDVNQDIKSGSNIGGGDMSGAGVLTPYTGKYAPLDGEGKKLFSIYMIGSDLERKGGAGTSDLNELIKGYNELSDKEKSNLNIMVAFGGANKDGWQGMRFATMKQIIKDSKDGIYGNSSDYQYVAPEANMGYKDSYALFLTYLQNNYDNHEYKFLDLWDHGSGQGYFLGPDDYYGADRKGNNVLHTYDFINVMKNINLKFNMIGFDTCLNGSLEVGKATHQFANYLVASEETEPGHGWNYTSVIKSLSKTNNSIELGRALVDGFVNDESHVESLTFSIVDLSAYKELEIAFNKLSDELKLMSKDEGLRKVVISAVRDTRGYAIDREDKTVKGMMDIYHFVYLLRVYLNMNELSSHIVYNLAGDVVEKLKNYIVYSQQDGTRINSMGVSIFSLNSKSYEYYGEYEQLSQNWSDVIQSYNSIEKDDVTKPILEEQNSSIDMEDLITGTRWRCQGAPNNTCPLPGGSYTQDGSYVPEYSPFSPFDINNLNNNGVFSKGNSQSSLLFGEQEAFVYKESKNTSRLNKTTSSQKVTSAKFSDANLKNVKTMYGNMIDNQFATVAILNAIPIFNDKNQIEKYFTPIWNQKWYTFKFNDTDQTAWIPLVFQEKRENRVVYSAEIDYIDKNVDYSGYAEEEAFDYAQLEIVVDDNNTLISHKIMPYTIEEIDGKEKIRFSKTKGELNIGDKIRFYSQSVDLETSESVFDRENDFITLEKKFNLDVEELQFDDEKGNPLDYYYIMIAEDISGNLAFTKPIKSKTN
jgi:hypothetical protein